MSAFRKPKPVPSLASETAPYRPGLRVLVARKPLLKLIQPLKGGPRPQLLGDKKGQYAVCLDASDPERVVLRASSCSEELGIPMAGAYSGEPDAGRACLPVNLLKRILKVMTDEMLLIEVAEPAIVRIVGADSEMELCMYGYRNHERISASLTSPTLAQDTLPDPQPVAVPVLAPEPQPIPVVEIKATPEPTATPTLPTLTDRQIARLGFQCGHRKAKLAALALRTGLTVDAIYGLMARYASAAVC